jgi:3-methylcrotonyl-CoA carboxylase alpha subunit
MFGSILIANRGEIAVRVMRTARRLGIRTIAVYSDADRDSIHVAEADSAYRIGEAPATQSYLRIDAIIEAARKSGAEAIHPGYGFLSENPDFVEACDKAGIVFVGPPAAAIRAMGLKDAAKRLMAAAGVPVVPGYHDPDQAPATLAKAAAAIGYPVLIKARAGGGGKGMRRVDRAGDFAEHFASAQREAQSSFGDGNVIIERYVSRPRHIEVQVFADAHGNALHFFERDCSLQRRHQKVIEEAPAPGMTAEMRQAMGEAAVKAALAVGYRGAGTVEFIADASEGLRPDRFYFMEMNTRLQVEHPVTEAITGLDLVELQLRVAAGERLTAKQEDIRLRGHAFEARIYAEDAERGFVPATGRLSHLSLPGSPARVDTGVREGDQITPYYDPMIAKVIVRGQTRPAALRALARALDATRTMGCVTNVGFLRALVRHPRVQAGDVDTALIESEVATLVKTIRPSSAVQALAGLSALGLLAEGVTAKGQAGIPIGWRQWGRATIHAELNWRDERLELRGVILGQGQYAFETPDGPVKIRVLGLDGERARVAVDGLVTDADVIRRNNEVGVFLGPEAHVFGIPDRLSAAQAEAMGSDNITAPLPGIVKLVHVSAGDKVVRGQALIVMEAMKMEHTLRAPRDGSIGEMLVGAGDLVEEGAMMVRLAQAEASKNS